MMNGGGISLGPLVMPVDRFSALIGFIVFMIVTGILARRVDPKIRQWSTYALFIGVIGARLGHVALYWEAFSEELWRVIAFWQGGMNLTSGLSAILVMSLLYVRTSKMAMAAGASIVISVFAWHVSTQLTATVYTTPPPKFPLQSLDGSSVQIDTFKGKPIIINIWATWCPPCRREMPLLAEVAAKRTDATFLFINQGESAASIKKYLTAASLSFPHVLLDQAGAVAQHYQTIGIPVTLFLRPDATLASIHMGEIPREILYENIDLLFRK